MKRHLVFTDALDLNGIGRVRGRLAVNTRANGEIHGSA